MLEAIAKFIKDEEGLTMVEYAIAGGLIVMAGTAAFQLVGQNVDAVIRLINDELDEVKNAGSGAT